MHIAIEGLDGAGKTTTAKALAKTLGFTFLQNPIYDIIGLEGYNISLGAIAKTSGTLNENISALFYGAGCMYMNYYRTVYAGIVTDRYICSTYYSDYNDTNAKLFDFLTAECAAPELTVLLYARPEIRKERIFLRNPNDSDLAKDFNDYGYETAEYFLKQHGMKYIITDNSSITLEETVRHITSELSRLNLLPHHE